MPFNRDATLRNAEKMLRQGKLDLAIADYRAVVDDEPSDWNTANTLGDLYVRAGDIDKAVIEYNRIADHLADEGFFPKAVALYRKILKFRPDDERAMWRLGGIAARQGLLVDARANYLTLAARRRARGDRQGEAEVIVCLGDLDGADLETRLAGAHARVELGDAATAAERLKSAADALRAKGKDADALRLLTEAAQIDPEDTDLRRTLVATFLAQGDFEAACQFATTAAELKGIADELFRLGREDEGINVLRSAAESDSADVGIRTQLAKLLVARDDIDGARALLGENVPEAGPDALLTLAEVDLRGGRTAEGTVALQQFLAADRSRRHAVVELACSMADTDPDAGYECVEIAAADAIAADEWPAAAEAFEAFISRAPNHIPALMRLVEICIDGGLESPMHSAQTRLADAYLAAGAGLEARVIAEDLVAREPWEPANIERFRDALTLLGETDIDALIAERLSGESPFTSTEPRRHARALAPELSPQPASEAADAGIAPTMAEDEPAVHAHMASPPPVEIDLSGVLRDLGHHRRASAIQPGAPIEAVFDAMRREVTGDSNPETAEQHFKLAATYMEIGMAADAMNALEVAAQSPAHRFRAAAMLGQAYLKSGDHERALEWYERAAEAAPPSEAAQHALLYELAALLESRSESARALAVWLELQSVAGEYRDVSARLEQLKTQMGR